MWFENSTHWHFGMSYLTNPYRYVIGETCQTVSNDDGLTAVGGGGSGNPITQVGLKLLTDSPFIGKTPTEIKFRISKDGSPTGVGTMKIYNGSNTLLATSTNTINVSTVADYPTYTQSTWTFSGLSALAENDTIAVQGWTADDSNKMQVKICSPQEYDNQQARKFDNGGWSNSGGSGDRQCDVCMA